QKDKYEWIYNHNIPTCPLTNTGFILTFIAANYISQRYHQRILSKNNNTNNKNNTTRPHPSQQQEQEQGYTYYTLGGADTTSMMKYKYDIALTMDENIGSLVHLTQNVASLYQPYNTTH